MEKLLFNKKALILFVMISILLVGMTYSSQFLVQSTSAKKSSPVKISDKVSTSNSVAKNNNTFIGLDALELKNETYRWQNTTQGINPTLHLVAHMDYVVK